MIPVTELEIGKAYSFFGGRRRIADIKTVDVGFNRVIWEYEDGIERGGKLGGECSIRYFSDKARTNKPKNNMDGPEYEGIHEFISMNYTSRHRNRAVKTLNKPFRRKGELLPLKDIIKSLVEEGFQIHGFGRKEHLVKGESKVPPKILSTAGLNYANYLISRIQPKQILPAPLSFPVVSRGGLNSIEELHNILEKRLASAESCRQPLYFVDEEDSAYILETVLLKDGSLKIEYSMNRRGFGTHLYDDSLETIGIRRKGISGLDGDGENFSICWA